MTHTADDMHDVSGDATRTDTVKANIRQVIFDALDLSEELRIECTADVVNALAESGVFSSLDVPAHPEGVKAKPNSQTSGSGA